MANPTVYDIARNVDAERFGLSTTYPGRWDLSRSQRDYLLTRRIYNRGGGTPRIIVLHIQEGNTPGSLSHWVSGMDRSGNPIAASATVLANRDGTLLRCIPEIHGPWTNGDVQSPTPKGQAAVAQWGRDPNTYTLSIEAEGYPVQEATESQLSAIVWQCREWMRQYGIAVGDVYRHSDFNSVTRIQCPGAYYDNVIAALQNPDEAPEKFPLGLPFSESVARTLFRSVSF